MKINCDHCGSEMDKKPSAITAKNYCDKTCRRNDKWEQGDCGFCGLPTERMRCASKNGKEMFCNRTCFGNWNSQRFTDSNPDWNQTKMTVEVKTKLRTARLGAGEGKGYAKVFGRHEHRIVAEQKLGRPLVKGEVVHHIDEDKRNNSPNNLLVFTTQKDHAAWHQFLSRLKSNSTC